MNAPTRRQKRHAATRQEILDTARTQIAEQGAPALSLRAVARQMEVTAPALYRYFKDRDDLVTALIVDAFRSFAGALEAAREAQPAGDHAGQVRAMCLAYRQWALAHPQDYLLIFGTPIPGYSAPAEITAPEAKRSFDIILAAFTDAQRGRRLKFAQAYQRPTPQLRAQVEAWRVKYGYTATTPAMLLTLVGWTRMHGLVSLELVHQLQPFFGDPAALFEAEVRRLLQDGGLA